MSEATPEELSARIEDAMRAMRREGRRRFQLATADDLARAELAIGDFINDLVGLEDQLKEDKEPQVPRIEDFEDKLALLELLLFGFEEELHRLSDDPAYQALLVSFERLLHALIDLLKSFEALVKSVVKPPRSLLESFEMLLKGCAALLRSFEFLLLLFPGNLPIALLQSFEDLIKGFEDLLDSFEDLIRRKHPKDRKLIVSFRDLLDELRELIGSFMDLLPTPTPPNLRRSRGDLVDRYEDLIDSLADLQKAIPPDPEEVEALVDLAIEAAKFILRAAKRGRRGRRTAEDNDELQRLAAKHARLANSVESFVKRIRRPQPLLRDGVEDLRWLQTKLDEAVGQGP